MNSTGLHTARKQEPQRTCVGCRRVDDQAQLLRAVADTAGRLRFDGAQRRTSGRGCYIHRQAACLLAAQRGGFARSLRRQVSLREGAVLDDLVRTGQNEKLSQLESPAPTKCGPKDRDNS